MKEYKNKNAKQILDILKPLVGELMATSIIKTQASKLGIDEEQITSVNVPQIAEGVRKGLVVFLGSEAAQQIGNRVASVK
jgi:hypothetical protein